MSGRFNSSRTSAKQFAVLPAAPEDANGIARIFLESAEHHAGLDPVHALLYCDIAKIAVMRRDQN